MTTINELSRSETVADADLIPMWNTSEGDTRAFPASALKDSTQVGVLRNDLAASSGSSLVGHIASGTGAVARTVQAKLRERTSVFDFLTAAEIADVQAGTLTLDVAAKVQAAIDAVYARDGGDLFLPEGKYLIGTTITLPQRVTLVGEGSGFVNQYGTNIAEPVGSVLYAKAGLNADVVQIQCRLYVDAGLLRETTLGRRNQDARHFGGLRNLVIWGNRSATATPTAVDRNSTGHGIHVRGARYVELTRVTSMFCAQEGLRTGEIDYGTRLIGVNNAEFLHVSVLSNGRHGAWLSIGDSRITQINAGYNAGDGIVESVGNTVIAGGLSWNNLGRGVYSGPQALYSASQIVGFISYDNDGAGFQIEGTGATTTVSSLIGCAARGNGRNTSLAGTARSNYLIGSLTQNWRIEACQANGYDQAGVQTSTYGFYVNATAAGSFRGTSFGAITQDIFFANPAAVYNPAQPGFALLSDMSANVKSITDIAALRWSAWATYNSITSGTVPITTANNLFALNCTGAQTVTDLSYSGSGIPFVIIRNVSADTVTFVHNTAKLRLANATNVVLSQHESIMFVLVTAGIWQQIGGAA